MKDLIGYDPRALLPDLRGPSKRFADFYSGGKLYPHQESIMAGLMDDRRLFPLIPTGRFRSEPEMQYLRPESGEAVVAPLRRKPTLHHVDYRELEARIHRATVMPKAMILDIDVVDKMSAPLAKLAEQFARTHMAAKEAALRAAINGAVFAAYIKMPRKRGKRPPMKEGDRITYLMQSRDPRQRKRGARLALKAFRRVFGVTPSNWDGKSGLNFYDTPLGEPYDPSRYRKD